MARHHVRYQLHHAVLRGSWQSSYGLSCQQGVHSRLTIRVTLAMPARQTWSQAVGPSASTRLSLREQASHEVNLNLLFSRYYYY
eukprot:5984107-Amphidinium_carterae.1